VETVKKELHLVEIDFCFLLLLVNVMHSCWIKLLIYLKKKKSSLT